MRKSLKGALIGATAALAAMTFAGAAQATILDIDATSNTGVTFVFAPGEYKIEFIGTAEGGAYNAWNPNCPGGVCPASGWRDAFSVHIVGDPVGQFEFFFVQGPAYSSALAALAGFKSSDITGVTTDAGNNVLDSELIHQPWIIDPEESVTAQFLIRDATRADNVGGVSLRITPVPEPATWLSLILGFGLIGSALRSRRKLALA